MPPSEPEQTRPEIPASGLNPSDFENLGVGIFKARLAERGIKIPTPVQKLVIPRLLAGEGGLFTSPTGTGKTFAYLLPLFQRFLVKPAPRSDPVILICAPTYELCSQIKAEADFLLGNGEGETEKGDGTEEGGGAAPGLKLSRRAALLIGTGNMSRQIEGLKKDKPAVIVGNAGRLLQLSRMGKLRFGGLCALVLDEGDRLCSDELFTETEELVHRALKGKTLKGQAPSGSEGEGRILASCSATLPVKSRERLGSLLGELPFFDAGEGGAIPDLISHWAIFSEGRRKIQTLRSFLAAARPRKALVFTSRREDVGKILGDLQHHHLAAGALFADMERKGLSRKHAMDDFRKGRFPVLVSTDLAARGLDIGDLSHIIALDVPQDAGAYLHRAGRTGRAGKRGIVVTIGDGPEMQALAKLEKKLGIAVYPKELRNGRVVVPCPDPPPPL
jgi:superfamily II DNA/RNA helicase